MRTRSATKRELSESDPAGQQLGEEEEREDSATSARTRGWFGAGNGGGPASVQQQQEVDEESLMNNIRKHHLAQHISATKRQRRNSSLFLSMSQGPSPHGEQAQGGSGDGSQPQSATTATAGAAYFGPASGPSSSVIDYPPPPSPPFAHRHPHSQQQPCSSTSVGRLLLDSVIAGAQTSSSSSSSLPFFPHANARISDALLSLMNSGDDLSVYLGRGPSGNEPLTNPAPIHVTHDGATQTTPSMELGLDELSDMDEEGDEDDDNDDDDEIEVTYTNIVPKPAAPSVHGHCGWGCVAAAGLSRFSSSSTKEVVRTFVKGLHAKYGTNSDGEEVEGGGKDDGDRDSQEGAGEAGDAAKVKIEGEEDIVVVKTTQSSASILSMRMEIQDLWHKLHAERSHTETQVGYLEQKSVRLSTELSATTYQLDQCRKELAASKTQLEEKQRLQAQVQQLQRELDQVKTDGQCVICFERRREVVFMPCLHFQSCDTCAKSLVDCCYCRKGIMGKVKVYQ